MQGSSEAVFQKDKHTILIPNMLPVHMELIADAFRADGYRVEILKCGGRPVLDMGLSYLHNDMCYPAICSVGQQLYAVTQGGYDTDRIALMQFQTGGGCRASNYVMLLKKALQRLGLSHIPVITLSWAAVNRNSGFHISPAMCIRALEALTYGDMLMLLKNQVRPYEVHPGDTDRLMERWYAHLHRELTKGAALNLGRMRKNLRAMVWEFSTVEVRRVKKPKVGIVGEVYVKYSPLGNNHLEEFLDTQDCEYMLPGMLGFVHFCLSNTAVDYSLYGGNPGQLLLGQGAGAVFSLYENAVRSALADDPQFVAPAPFAKMQAYGDRLLHRGVKMGEGWYLPAEMAELIENGYDNILCVQPFGCLPNHIVGRGVASRIREQYPSANLCSIDYDASASAVNQENRIALMLAIARDRLRDEGSQAPVPAAPPVVFSSARPARQSVLYSLPQKRRNGNGSRPKKKRRLSLAPSQPPL